MSSVADTSNQRKEDPPLMEVDQKSTSKKSIEFNHLGQAVGPNATHFKSQVGKYVKTYVPISYISWIMVPKTYKDDVWNEIVAEFDIPEYLRKDVESSMPDVFRKLKHTLRKRHLDKQPNLEAKMLAIPNGIRKEDWEQFCINEVDEKQVKRRATAVESRKHSVYGHTGGRKSSAMVEYEMKAKREDPTIPITRTQVWIETHTKKDRTTLASAEPFMKLVKEKLVESTQSESENSSVHPLSIDNDPLTQVFGKKVKGLPGVGSFVSKRKYNAALHGHIMYTEERGERECLKNKVDEMQTKVNFIFDYCKSQTGGPLAPIPQSTGGSSTHVPMPHVGGSSSPISMSQAAGGSSTPMLQELQAIVGKSKPMPPTTTNNAHGPSSDERDSTTPARTETTHKARLCELFDWNWNCVAVAREVIDPMHRGNCHNYQLNPQYEMKVSMCVRKIFLAKLYKETPDATIIKEVGIGEFFVWSKSHIKFVEASI